MSSNEPPTIWDEYRAKIAAGEPLTQVQLQGLLIRAASFVHLVKLIKTYGNDQTKSGETCECAVCTVARTVCSFFSDHAAVISAAVAGCVQNEKRMPSAFDVDSNNLTFVISAVLSAMSTKPDKAVHTDKGQIN